MCIYIFVLKFKQKHALLFLLRMTNVWLIYSPENKRALGHWFEIRLITIILKVKNPQVFAIVTMRWWGEENIF